MDLELTELDDWVGTLEELQLGLERKCPPTPSNRLPSSSSSSSAKSSFSDSRHLSRTPPDQSLPWRVVQTSDSQSGLPRAPPPPPPPPPSVPVEDSNYLEKRDGEDQDSSASAANTLTQSIRASFNPLSCREATAENDLNSLLRQLEEVENTMKQLEQDDGGFTRRYSLASSSTTDPNTGCNPSPAPDAPEQVTTSSPLPLATNGHSHIINADQLNAERVARKAMPIPPSVPLRPPSPSNTDYELADDTSVAALLAPSVAISTKPTNTVLHDDGLVDEAQGEREQRNDLQRYRSMEVASPSNQTQANRFSSIDSASVRRSSLAALRPPPPPPLPPPQSPLGSSNEVSLSDKSVSEFPELFKKLSQVVDLADRLQLNKLVVRIFRPDRTTKAILIDQRMAAGEIASILIEKNFLEPSVKLCLVEKVPSLKVERVFEESDSVAECILAWPIKSQNMIFFESRDDHFGFIESPEDWLGETYANAHGFHSSDSVQTMLENFTSSGLAEWHDFLYIRKPGEKTWTRRMCVLRNSGLYATKKNKKAFLASDLVRLLALDDKLHIYTTTGGWSRMRAPTPHGFALKTYAAQDFSSSHVFCFCAPDENALKQWACRLRLAKYGIGLLRDYQVAKERVSRGLDAGLQAQKRVTESKQSSMERARSSSFQALQPPLQRLQGSGINIGAANQVTRPLTMTPPPSAQQRIAPRTPQPPTTRRRPPDSPLHNGCTKHNSTGATSQHFYIR